jgi:tellurite resistance protein
MRTRDAINAPEALVLTMVLMSVADGGMTDREIGIMSGLVQTLPAFEDFTTEELADVTDRAAELLNDDDGLAHAARLMRAALNPKLRETAYALACEVVAGGEGARRQSMDMLDFVRVELGLDQLVSVAI